MTDDESKCLPSGESAKKLVRGEPGGLSSAAFHTALRAGLIGTGMYVAGCRKGLVKYSIAGSVAVELFVITYTWGKQ